MKKKMKKIIVAICMVAIISFSLSIATIKNENNGEWNKEYEGSHFFDIEPTKRGYVIVGTFWKQGEGNGLIMKVDENGNMIWQRCYGGRDEDGLWCVLETEDGYLAGGYTFSYGGLYNEDFWLIKVDRNGNEIWNKTYGTKDGVLGGITKAKDGGYLIVGSVPGFKNNVDIVDDVLLLKIDENGDMIWYKSFGGNNTEAGDCIIEIDDGYLISGVTVSYATYGVSDAWLIKIDEKAIINEPSNATPSPSMEIAPFVPGSTFFKFVMK